MSGAMNVVGSGTSDDIDEATTASPKLGGSVGRDDLKLFDGIETNGEGGALATTLFAEEGIVVVGTVDGDVVVDPFIAVNGDLVPIGTLHDSDTGRKRDKAEEIAAVVGQIAYRLLVEVSGLFDLTGFNDGRLFFDVDGLLKLGQTELQGERNGLTDGEIETFADERSEAGGLNSDFVAAER